MRIVGKWHVSDDGITRPVVEADVQATDGGSRPEKFLIDSGADRTVLTASLLRKLSLPAIPAPTDQILEGVGGESGFVLVRTVIELPCDDGGVANMRGEFAAFTHTSATDLSILGRDILKHFDLILSHRRKEVLLLAFNHQYRVDLV